MLKRGETKSNGEKERYTHLNAVSKNSKRERRKLSSVINTKKYRNTKEWERLENSSRKL